MTGQSCPSVPVSWGELLDKITILEIKLERISNPAACLNIGREWRQLTRVAAETLERREVKAPLAALRQVNEQLWDVEDAIRREDASGRFGAEFVRLARAVYRHNDRRAEIKRELNHLLESDLAEEKSYWSKRTGPRAASSLARVS